MDLLQVIFPVAGIKTYLFTPPIVAFTISFFTSMAGISGAFLLLPFQMRVLGFTSISVTSTNFLFNVTGTPGGVCRYIKECRFTWPVALTSEEGFYEGTDPTIPQDKKGHPPFNSIQASRQVKVGVCIICHRHISVGTFAGVHKKSFHDQLMESTWAPGLTFHSIYEKNQFLPPGENE